MGVYSIGLISRIDVSELSLGTFWRVCESVSKRLHQRLDNDEDISAVLDGFDFQEFEVKRDIYERRFNYGISNVGRVESTKPSASLKTTELYFGFSMIEDHVVFTMISIVATLNGTLTWVVSFNDRLYKRTIVRDLITNINRNIDKLLLS